ncbi:MAG: MFS transporter [Anaerolineae bacterium]|nr:MFS transporter [Anaerolineae bacterium]
MAAYPWPFFVAMAASFLLFFSFQAIFPVSPLYIAEVGGTSADNGLGTWVFALAALLTRPLAGLLADRWGRKPILVLGAVFFGSGPALHALAFNIPSLLAAKVFHGIGLACFATAYQAFIADLLPPDRYGAGLGLANIAASVAMVVAPLFGEWMVARFDFRLSFLTFGAIGGLGLVATLVLLGWNSGFARESSSAGGGPWEALRQPGVRVGALWMALLGLPFGAFITFLPLLASARNLGGTGGAYAVYALASTLSRPVAGYAADKWDTRGITLVGLVLVGLSAIGLASVTDGWILMGLAMLFGVGSGSATASLDAAVQSSVGESLRGGAAAIQYTAFDMLVGFGTLGLGLVAEAAGYGVMYSVASGVVLLGAVAGGIGWCRVNRRLDSDALV